MLISITSFIAAGVILIVGRSWTPAVVFGILLRDGRSGRSVLSSNGSRTASSSMSGNSLSLHCTVVIAQVHRRRVETWTDADALIVQPEVELAGRDQGTVTVRERT